MRGRQRWLGPGPVFIYEWITSARRWQPYAVRSLFVLLILVGMLMIWMIWTNESQASNRTTIAKLVQLGQGFFAAISGTMLVVVLLAAPAATAGAICLDRARGTLTHMLVTDLSNVEIVVGKLAARLVPILTLVACTLPVLQLLTLLGGVQPDALVGVLFVTAGIAVLGCSLALVFSLWVGKTHEALLWTYAVWGLWMLAEPISQLLGAIPGWPYPALPSTSNPFVLAFAPYFSPDTVGWTDYVWFLGGTCAISALLIAVAVLRVRAVCTRERVVKIKKPRAIPRGSVWRFLAQNVPWVTPSLDRNPVAWREWRRGRLTRSGVVVTSVYVGLCCLFSVAAIFWSNRVLSLFVNGIQASVGLLLLSVTAATSLAEERARGSLELLLTTPLSSRQIVFGKWIGAFRLVPLLPLLPWLVIAAISYIDERSSWPVQILGFAYVLSVGAAITSLGLAMATWCSRLGAQSG